MKEEFPIEHYRRRCKWHRLVYRLAYNGDHYMRDGTLDIAPPALLTKPEEQLTSCFRAPIRAV